MNNTNDHSFDTVYNFDYLSTSGALTALFDTSYSVMCYDGLGSGNAITPFGAPSAATYFPSNAANFGLLNLPLFVFVGSNSTAVTSVTFLVGLTANSIDTTTTINVETSMMVTIAYAPDGSFLGASGRNEHGGVSDLPIESMFQLESQTSTTLNLYSCGFYGPSQTKVKNRLISGISKSLPLNGAVVTYPLTDGPDCGASGYVDSGNNRAKSCSSTSTTTYWIRVK